MNSLANVNKLNYVAFLVCLIVAAFLVEPQTKIQDPQPADSSLTDRVVQLEQRIEQLERIVFSNAKLSLTQAERRHEEAKTILAHSRALFAKGFITDRQLQQDKFSVEQAVQEVQLAKTDQRQQQLAGEMDVLHAEQKLFEAKSRLDHSEKLESRGFVTKTEVRSARTDLEISQKELENAQLKLEAARKMQSLKDGSK